MQIWHLEYRVGDGGGSSGAGCSRESGGIGGGDLEDLAEDAGRRKRKEIALTRCWQIFQTLQLVCLHLQWLATALGLRTFPQPRELFNQREFVTLFTHDAFANETI